RLSPPTFSPSATTTHGALPLPSPANRNTFANGLLLPSPPPQSHLALGSTTTGRGCPCNGSLPPYPPTPAMRQLSDGSSATAVPAPTRMAACRERRWCVMALDAGPDRAVCVPGARERALSREVAKVRVTKGRRGRRGSVEEEEEEEEEEEGRR
ncbi:hypothetical protein DIS24_g10233, partial [Lasiodiplodia hormozganensis]